MATWWFPGTADSWLSIALSWCGTALQFCNNHGSWAFPEISEYMWLLYGQCFKSCCTESSPQSSRRIIVSPSTQGIFFLSSGTPTTASGWIRVKGKECVRKIGPIPNHPLTLIPKTLLTSSNRYQRMSQIYYVEFLPSPSSWSYYSLLVKEELVNQ